MDKQYQKPLASEPPYKKLDELLDWWAAVEPERCQYSEDLEFEEPWYTISFETGRVHIEFKKATQEDHALLQASVQKTVESKGWFWSILHASKGVYRAGVKISERYVSETGRFPAHALLAAYLKALELTQKNHP